MIERELCVRGISWRAHPHVQPCPVGNAEDEGALDDGLTGASSEDGKRDLGRELGMESKFTAMSILDVPRPISTKRRMADAGTLTQSLGQPSGF